MAFNPATPSKPVEDTSNNQMFLEMGLSAIGSAADFIVSSENAKLKESIREFSNRMSGINTALNLGALNANDIALQEQASFGRISIEMARLSDLANAEVSAAAAGVEGNAVDIGLADTSAAAGRASSLLDNNFRRVRLAQGQERRQVKVAGIFNKDISVVSKPSPILASLGVTTNLLNIRDRNVSEDKKISSIISRGI